MPTFREDLHVGHKVPLVETDDIMDGAISTEKLGDGAVTHAKLADDAVDTNNLRDRSVTTEKLKDGAVTAEKLGEDVSKTINNTKAATENLQNQIDSIEAAGFQVSNHLGSSEHTGVSQKTITDVVNRIWDKIEEYTGETLHGINMTVSPSYFIGTEGDVHVTASTVDTDGKFEHIAFYVNDELVKEEEDKDYFECDVVITDTCVLKCVATILGIEYTRQQTVTKHDSLWLGSIDDIANIEDIMDVEHVIELRHHMRGSYDVTCSAGEHITIVMGDSLDEGFIRADMNGFEIPFDVSTVTVDDKEYQVYLSSNTYQAGTYNINING